MIKQINLESRYLKAVQEYTIHPDYDHEYLRNDFVLIRFVKNLMFSSSSNATCLPSFTDPTHQSSQFQRTQMSHTLQMHNEYQWKNTLDHWKSQDTKAHTLLIGELVLCTGALGYGGLKLNAKKICLGI